MPYRRASVPVIVAPAYINGTHMIRETGRKGAYVVAVDSNPQAIGFRSRYTKESVVVDSPGVVPGAFTEMLLGRIDLHGGLVIPTDDYFVKEIHSNYDSLRPHYKLAVSPGPSTTIALDKNAAYVAAAEAGLTVPRTVEVGDESQLAEAIKETGFPSILRAVFSIPFVREFGKKNFYIDSLDELHEKFRLAISSGHKMLLQEMIPGDDDMLATVRGYAFDNGDLSTILTGRKLLQYPPIFGIGQLHESQRIPHLATDVARFVRKIDFRGSIFCIEFKYDTRDSKWKFIEMNCRAVMSTGFTKYAGVDIVDMLFRDKLGLPRMPPSTVRYGRRWTWIKSALLRHRGFPEHRRSLREYIRLYRPPIRLGLFDLWDLKPFLIDIGPLAARRFDWIRAAADRLRGPW